MFDRSPIGMYRCDRGGRLHHVNPALVRTLGYGSADELMACNLGLEIFVEPGELAAAFERARRDDGAAMRTRWRTRHGAELAVELHGHLADGSDGTLLDVSVLDVTTHDRTSDALARQRDELATTSAMLDLVVSQMTAIYWVVDRDLTILKSGGAIQDLLGAPHGRFLGMTIEQVHRLEEASVDPTVMHRRAVAGETVRYANVFRSKHLLTTLCPHRRGGEIIGAIGTCIDVTSHHLLESRMVDAQRAESLGVLAGGLAHDLNNLLGVILGNVDLALRYRVPLDGDRAQRTPLDNIRQASLRAAELIEQLLTYAGHGATVATRVSASRVIDELLRISAPTMPSQVTVHVDVTRDLVLRGDATQIRQVLLNLIGNARDALGERGGTITVTGGHVRHDGANHPDDIVTAPAGTYVVLTVADDGPGIDREVRRRIFEPFFTTKPTGHGLGLAAVLGIVRSHGGGLRLTTSPDAGARFEALWPSAATPCEHPAATPPGNSHTVLLIEHEDRVRDVVARMLEELGYAAITANDGASGLAIVDSVPIDAVLVDLATPKTTGLDVVTALRARRPGLPIILCSPLDRAGPGVPADAYLAKPFRIDTLDSTLARLLPG